MRQFVTTGLCVPSKHYMADTSEKIAKIRKMIDDGGYFTINRGRQYGKTTTLFLLRKLLEDNCVVISLCFQGLGDDTFADARAFCQTLLHIIHKSLCVTYGENEYTHSWLDESVDNFGKLDSHITKLCRDKKVVLFIDEVDKTSTNQTFLDFLGMLRGKFLAAQAGDDFTFQSVVLAGVHDIKNIKQKLIREGKHELKSGEGSYNSPWNIAVDFEVDMSLNPKEIASMLGEYENDHHTGMDIATISQEIHSYTSGYPFLVSRICQHIARKGWPWTVNSVQQAVEIIVKERSTLVDDLVKNMENNPNLYRLLHDMVFTELTPPTSYNTPEIQLGLMYDILAVKNRLDISNVIFKSIITDYIIEKNRAEMREKMVVYFANRYIENGKLNMELILRKFSDFMYEEYREADAKFIEQNGRLLFLSFLKPIINGYGYTFVETETRLNKRMDVLVVFEQQQFIIEIKLWYGEAKHDAAYEQILEYMNSKNLPEGYLLTFDFRKNINKVRKTEWITIDDKRIYDVVV